MHVPVTGCGVVVIKPPPENVQYTNIKLICLLKVL